MKIEAGYSLDHGRTVPTIECRDTEPIYLLPDGGDRGDRLSIDYDPRTGIWSLRGDRIMLAQGTAANTIEFKFTNRGLRGLST